MACRDSEALVQTALQAFKTNATPFWQGRIKAQALQATHAARKKRARFLAWRRWAERRCLLKERLIIGAVACRRGALAAGGVLLPGVPEFMTL